MIRGKKKSGSILGSIAGAIMNLFTKKTETPPGHLENADFPASTQKIGVSFNKKIRDKFRNNWLKKR